MSPVDVARLSIQASCNFAEGVLDNLQKHGPAMIRIAVRVNPITSTWPPPLQNLLANLWIQQLEFAIQIGRSAITILRKMAEMMGSPDALRYYARQVIEPVVVSVKQLESDVRPNDLDSKYSWSGEGADRYKDIIGDQQTSVGLITDPAKLIATTLEDMASSIEVFYAQSALSALELEKAVIMLAAGIVALCTGVAAPAAIIAFVGTCISVLTAAGNIGLACLIQNVANEARVQPLADSLPAKWRDPHWD